MRSNRWKHGYAPLHGKRNPTYVAWQSMNSRCYNPNNSHYKHYGGRGIVVCERWRGPSGFINFLEDMRETVLGMSIERRNNNINYCPENCRWIPKQEQPRNRRHNWMVNLDGETITAVEATRRLGMNHSSISLRLRKMNASKEDCFDVRELVSQARSGKHKKKSSL